MENPYILLSESADENVIGVYPQCNDFVKGTSTEEEERIYPFGLSFEVRNFDAAAAVNRRSFGGKELDRTAGLNLYDQEARLYDPATGRFTRPDPLSERTPGISEFLFCAANPVNYIDPSGMVFTEGSKSYVKSLKKGIKDRQDKNKRKIEDLKSELSAGELSEKNRKRFSAKSTNSKTRMPICRRWRMKFPFWRIPTRYMTWYWIPTKTMIATLHSEKRQSSA